MSTRDERDSGTPAVSPVTSNNDDLANKVIVAADKLGIALRSARQDVATEYGLSPLQLRLIEHVGSHPPQRVGALAAELDVTQPTVSDALATLESKGLTRRIPDLADRRASLIALTDGGQRSAAAINAALEPIYRGPRERDEPALGSALAVILEEIQRLQKAGVITVNRSCLSCDHYQPPSGEASAVCLLLNASLEIGDLRVDCSDHSTISP